MSTDRQYHVIYLTGAPATGKSTLTKNLSDAISPLKVFAYSERLANFICQRSTSQISENNLREQSAKIVTIDHVKAVDNELLEFVRNERLNSHCGGPQKLDNVLSSGSHLERSFS